SGRGSNPEWGDLAGKGDSGLFGANARNAGRIEESLQLASGNRGSHSRHEDFQRVRNGSLIGRRLYLWAGSEITFLISEHHGWWPIRRDHGPLPESAGWPVFVCV